MSAMPPAAAAAEAPVRRRPAAVTILASLQILSALLLGLLALLLVLDPEAALPEFAIPGADGGSGATLVLEAASVAVVVALLGGLELFAAVALLRLHRLGWTLTMLLAGFFLASQIITWWSTTEVLAVSMLLNVATVLYLNQRQVRAAFDLADGRTADLEGDRG
jgi:hypothetical protein